MMSVDVFSGLTFELGTPRPLFPGVWLDENQVGRNYAVSIDGRRLLVRVPAHTGELPATTVFINWVAGLQGD